VTERQPSGWDLAVHELHKRSLRGIKRPLRRLWMHRLMQRNLHSDEPLLSADGPVVSLTTYEPRWHNVHYTIESIGCGRLRPSRLVLWIAPSVLQLGTPDTLQRLVARGLEIRTCEELGSHKKYYPQVCSGTAARGLVTADDDLLYRGEWLQTLVAAAAARPAFIHAHRADVISFAADGSFLPYIRWPACRSTAPSALHFATSGAGVLFDAAMQEALRDAGDGFLSCCPRADDIWLNAVAWRSAVPVCQTRVFSQLLFEVPGTRAHGLARDNVQGGGNDRQLQMTYTPEERARLRALAAQEHGPSSA
jgi:hypothetical protein